MSGGRGWWRLCLQNNLGQLFYGVSITGYLLHLLAIRDEMPCEVSFFGLKGDTEDLRSSHAHFWTVIE